MSENTDNFPKKIYRNLCLDDLGIDDNDNSNNNNSKHTYDRNSSYNNTNTIAKNQQEFGQKKRIKP